MCGGEYHCYNPIMRTTDRKAFSWLRGPGGLKTSYTHPHLGPPSLQINGIRSCPKLSMILRLYTLSGRGGGGRGLGQKMSSTLVIATSKYRTSNRRHYYVYFLSRRILNTLLTWSVFCSDYPELCTQQLAFIFNIR